MPRLSLRERVESTGSDDAGMLPILDEGGKLDTSLFRADALRDLIDGPGSVTTATGPATPSVGVGITALVNVAAGAVTISLPATHAEGSRIAIKLTSAAAYDCTIDPNGSQTIDGEPTLVLSTDYEWAELISDGTNWFQIG